METTLDRLREYAKEVVRREPTVEAVVLFGSRARGTAGPRSDWDVALIEHGGRAAETAYRLFDTLPGVRPLGIGAGEIARHKDTAGSLEAALARQGIMLAGVWRRPECRKEGLTMDMVRIWASLENATDEVGKAIMAGIDLRYATGRRRRTDWTPITTGSVDAAEHVAKAIMAGYGLSPREVHFLDALASQLENARRGRDDPRQADWSERIRAMNGTTRALRLHDADYRRFTQPPAEPIERSVERTGQAQRAQILWLREMAERWPDLAEDVADAARAVVRKGRRLDSYRTSYEGEAVTADESTCTILGRLEESTVDWVENARELLARIEGEAHDRSGRDG